MSIVSWLFVPVYVLHDKMFDDHNYDDELDFVPILASSEIVQNEDSCSSNEFNQIYKRKNPAVRTQFILPTGCDDIRSSNLMVFYPSHEYLTQRKNSRRRTYTRTTNAASTNITIDIVQFS